MRGCVVFICEQPSMEEGLTMAILDAPEATATGTQTHVAPQPTTTNLTLGDSVERAMTNYFNRVREGGQAVSNLYNLVLSEVEPAIIAAVMRFTKGNQSKAAILLGISRGTLRKKIKQYGVEWISD